MKLADVRQLHGLRCSIGFPAEPDQTGLHGDATHMDMPQLERCTHMITVEEATPALEGALIET